MHPNRNEETLPIMSLQIIIVMLDNIEDGFVYVFLDIILLSPP